MKLKVEHFNYLFVFLFIFSNSLHCIMVSIKKYKKFSKLVTHLIYFNFSSIYRLNIKQSLCVKNSCICTINYYNKIKFKKKEKELNIFI